jgi:hypothetical protein
LKRFIANDDAGFGDLMGLGGLDRLQDKIRHGIFRSVEDSAQYLECHWSTWKSAQHAAITLPAAALIP